MNRIYKFVSIAALLVSVVALLLVLFKNNQAEKSAYVLLNELRDSFTLGKEMDAKFQSMVRQRNFLLDSIRYNMNLAEQKGMKEFDYYKLTYEKKVKEFESSNMQVRNQFDQQIWKQLNQYLEEYGKEMEYSFIFGASGTGSLMYGNERKNVTQEALKFVNDRYKGK